MKKTLATLLMAMAVVMGMTSCTDEPTQPNNVQTYEKLTGTSWEGTYETTFTSPYGEQPMILEWVVDYNTDSTGIVMLTLKTPVSDDVEKEFAMSYTYDGQSKGELNYDVYGMMWYGGFEVDAINRTLHANLQVLVTTSEDENAEPLPFGGVTTLYQVAR